MNRIASIHENWSRWNSCSTRARYLPAFARYFPASAPRAATNTATELSNAAAHDTDQRRPEAEHHGAEDDDPELRREKRQRHR